MKKYFSNFLFYDYAIVDVDVFCFVVITPSLSNYRMNIFFLSNLHNSLKIKFAESVGFYFNKPPSRVIKVDFITKVRFENYLKWILNLLFIFLMLVYFESRFLCLTETPEYNFQKMDYLVIFRLNCEKFLLF